MIPTIADASEARSGHSPGSDQGLGIGGDGGQIAASPAHQQNEVLPASIEDFDAIINGIVKTYVNVSEEIGGLVAEQVWCLEALRLLSC